MRDLQQVIDKDPWVTNVVYGDFEDPKTGLNFILVQYQRSNSKADSRKMSQTIKRFLKPMFRSKKAGDQFYNFEGEQVFGTHQGRQWDLRHVTRLRWDGTTLRKMLREAKS